MKYALIGNGFIAPRHIKSIEETGGELLMVCDIDPKKEIKGLPFYTRYNEMAQDKRWKEVGTVVICSPNDEHIRQAKWAVGCGKKVICEKPLDFRGNAVRRIAGMQSIFTVFQLRYHPLMKQILDMDYDDVTLYVKVKRDKSYWDGWKGDEKRSGGMLFNLGVHYFDVLFQMYGDNCMYVDREIDEERHYKAKLYFYGHSKPVKVEMMIDDTDVGQDRYIEINGEKFRFSDKDNLSFEDLHTKLYEDFLKGNGVHPDEVLPLTRFIEQVKGNVIPSV